MCSWVEIGKTTERERERERQHRIEHYRYLHRVLWEYPPHSDQLMCVVDAPKAKKRTTE